MKIKESARPNGSKRISYDFSDEKVITDQVPLQELTMASIIKKLEKGIMPNFQSDLIYSSDPGVRNLQDVIERQKHAEELFYELPVEIRNLMGHDIMNLEKVLIDPQNKDLLEKHGLIQTKRDQHTELLTAISQLREQNTPEPIQETLPKSSKKA